VPVCGHVQAGVSCPVRLVRMSAEGAVACATWLGLGPANRRISQKNEKKRLTFGGELGIQGEALEALRGSINKTQTKAKTDYIMQVTCTVSWPISRKLGINQIE